MRLSEHTNRRKGQLQASDTPLTAESIFWRDSGSRRDTLPTAEYAVTLCRSVQSGKVSVLLQWDCTEHSTGPF